MVATRSQLPITIAANIEHFTGRTWLLPEILKWIEQSDERIFLLTGGPGTGKSMIMAWLAGASPSPVDPQAERQLDQIRSRAKAIHFCVAAGGSTSPKAFAQNVAEQLTRNVKGFGDALVATLGHKVQITINQDVNIVESGASVTGVYIRRLDLGDLSDEFSFNQTLREPLKRLYEEGFNEPIVILVDALDEALTYTGNINIVQLLAQLTDIPAPVRFLVTTRPDRRVLKQYSKVKPFDLIDDAPSEYDDVRTYGYERLADLPVEHLGGLAERISRAAQGNFLYASLVISDLSGRLSEIPDLDSLRLPKGLAGIYHDFLNRELGADEDRWFEAFKPILGLVAVARGEGLNRAQIERIIGKDVESVLRICQQYLEGQTPEGPFRPFHKSFADYLLEDEENHDYHIDAAGMHRQIADYYWGTYSGDWQNFKDDYGLNNLAVHLYESGNNERLRALISEGWMRARYAGSRYTYNGFLDDVNLAWQTELAKEAYDVVTLVRLQTARQAVTQQVSLYLDIDLKTLVWLERKQEALAHAQLRTKAEEKFKGLLSIYAALRERGRAEIDLLNEAEEVAGAIPYKEPRAEALRELAAALAQAGERRASEVFAQAEETARAITDDRWRANALRKLAAALAQAGESRASEVFAQVEETARAITDDGQRAEALRELAVALAHAGHFDQALTTLGSRSLTECLQALASWAPAVERRKPGLSVAVLREATGVAGWVSSNWRKIHERLFHAG
jgi:hypothetical protein